MLLHMDFTNVEKDTLQRLLYTPREAALLLGLSRSHVYELLASQRLHSVKIGRSRRVPADALVHFVQSLSNG